MSALPSLPPAWGESCTLHVYLPPDGDHIVTSYLASGLTQKQDLSRMALGGWGIMVIAKILLNVVQDVREKKGGLEELIP